MKILNILLVVSILFTFNSVVNAQDNTLGGYLIKGEKLLLSLEEVINPKHTALVIVDMQNDYIYGSGKTVPTPGKPLNANEQVVPNVIKFVEVCRKANVPIFWVICHHGRDLDIPAYKARMARRKAIPLVMQGTKGAEIVSGLVPKDPERIFIKHGYDGFTDTDLDTALQNKGITSIILAGVNTNTCVDATLKHGFHLGYYTVAGSDIMATTDEGAQEMYLKSFARHYGLAATNEQMAKIWGVKIE